MSFLFTLTLFASAALLFAVQPMVGKLVLPLYGGTPAIWNTCMVFFQAALLAGYAYAHVVSVRLRFSRQWVIQMMILVAGLCTLPFTLDAQPLPEQTSPAIWLLIRLALVAGLPMFAVSTTAPLMQRWLARTTHRDASDPYFLYAVSNTGSLLALLSYPIIIEPQLTLPRQAEIWAWGYACLVVLSGSCGIAVWRANTALSGWEISAATNDRKSKSASAVTPRTWLKWTALAFVPSSLMLGVTTHLSTDVASAPLLWVLPLAVYLLSFINAFARRPLIPRTLALRCLPWVVAIAPAILYWPPVQTLTFMLPTHLMILLVVALAAHGELADRRPEPDHLTAFYLATSLGGVLGGIFNALLAPILFNSIIEYPLVLLLSVWLLSPPVAASSQSRRLAMVWIPLVFAVAAWAAIELQPLVGATGRWQRVLWLAAPALGCLTVRRHRLTFVLSCAAIMAVFAAVRQQRLGEVLFADRGFFGVNRVLLDQRRGLHTLINGRTYHGMQKMLPEPSTDPLAYYHPDGPLGDIFAMLNSDRDLREIGVIGLGAGTIATYARPTQTVTFFEIDPVMRDIARNEEWFTFLSDSKGDTRIVMGDARLQMETVADGKYDVLILDAFSSDAIPAHLITREAIELFLRKLNPEGVLVLHISNKYLRLEPLCAALADRLELRARHRRDEPERGSRKKWSSTRALSHVVAMTRRTSDLGKLEEDPRWRELRKENDVQVWTDSYSSLWDVMVW